MARPINHCRIFKKKSIDSCGIEAVGRDCDFEKKADGCNAKICRC